MRLLGERMRMFGERLTMFGEGGRPMRTEILVVDDSASDRLIIQKMLSDYSVLLACDGLEAMRQIEEHEDISLIILDLKMPNMDGFAVLEALKSNPKYERLRAIILTNYEELQNEVRGLRMGAVDYIRKPTNMHSLRARIGVHSELLRVQRALEQRLKEQRQTFDAILHQAAVGIAISLDSQGMPAEEAGYVSVNPMFEQITGRTRDKLIKLGWASITHPDDLDEDLENYRRLQSGEVSSYTMDKRLVKPDGSVVWVHWNIARLTLSDDNRIDHICLINDITDHKRMEQALIESERSKSVLLSHLPGLAYRCLYDRDWTMQYVSAGCLKLTGYPAESLLYNRDLSFNDLVAPEYREDLWTEWRRILTDRQPFEYEYEIITAGRERKWVLELGEGIFNDTGEIEALEGIIIDITDRKAIESTLKYTSEHDRLTGLYNRNYLEDLLKSHAKKRLTEKRALVGINLSATQSLTRAYGFNYTHDLVRSIVDALVAHTANNRTLFSIDDNHLAFYLRGYSGKEELADFCQAVADTLEPMLKDEGIDGAIGVLEIDRNDEYDADQIMKDLMAASERATDTVDRGFRICYYDAEIESQIIREQEVKHELT
jgi:PAS domain S-box-containing protein